MTFALNVFVSCERKSTNYLQYLLRRTVCDLLPCISLTTSSFVEYTFPISGPSRIKPSIFCIYETFPYHVPAFCSRANKPVFLHFHISFFFPLSTPARTDEWLFSSLATLSLALSVPFSVEVILTPIHVQLRFRS